MLDWGSKFKAVFRARSKRNLLHSDKGHRASRKVQRTQGSNPTIRSPNPVTKPLELWLKLSVGLRAFRVWGFKGLYRHNGTDSGSDYIIMGYILGGLWQLRVWLGCFELGFQL